MTHWPDLRQNILIIQWIIVLFASLCYKYITTFCAPVKTLLPNPHKYVGLCMLLKHPESTTASKWICLCFNQCSCPHLHLTLYVQNCVRKLFFPTSLSKSIFHNVFHDVQISRWDVGFIRTSVIRRRRRKRDWVTAAVMLSFICYAAMQKREQFGCKFVMIFFFFLPTLFLYDKCMYQQLSTCYLTMKWMKWAFRLVSMSQ